MKYFSVLVLSVCLIVATVFNIRKEATIEAYEKFNARMFNIATNAQQVALQLENQFLRTNQMEITIQAVTDKDMMDMWLVAAAGYAVLAEEAGLDAGDLRALLHSAKEGNNPDAFAEISKELVKLGSKIRQRLHQ